MTPSLMTADQLLAELQKPFPKSDHKVRKLPGGGSRIYISWKAIRSRLNKLCGLNWSLEYTDPAIAGDYLVIRCRLTIMNTTREGLGNNRVYPDLNSEGKPKIIGTPPKNAAAEAFINAAKAFGMGEYLDDQAYVKQLLTEFDRRRQQINEIKRQCNVTKEQVIDLLQTHWGVDDLEELTLEECDRLVDLIEQTAKLNRSLG